MTINYIDPVIIGIVALVFVQLIFLKIYSNFLKIYKQSMSALESKQSKMRRKFDQQTAELGALSMRVHTIEARQENLQPVNASTHEQKLRYAIRMAQRGSTAEDLILVCDINRSEAEILSRIHYRGTNETVGEIPLAKAN